MAAEEGPVEDPFELPALLALVRRAPGPEVSPPGEAGSKNFRDETQGRAQNKGVNQNRLFLETGGGLA